MAETEDKSDDVTSDVTETIKKSDEGMVGDVESTKKSDDNLMAAIAYLLCFVTGIIVYVVYKEKGNKFVLFHAVQSIILGVAVFCLAILLTFGQIILVFIPFIGWIISLLLFFVWMGLGLVLIVVWIFLMYKAYNGEKYKLPVLGDMAQKYAG